MKTPPFGRPLIESKPSNEIYCFIGANAWEKGHISSKMRPGRTLVLPPDASPLAYDWPISNCDILIVETSPLDTDFIENFVDLLFSYGANLIVLISMDLHSTFYKKDFSL